MTTYVYKAKKSTAETVTGKISAQTEDEAIDLINQLGFLPVSVKPEEGNVEITRPEKVSLKQTYVFSRQLANLLKSGVSLLKALSILEDQMQKGCFKTVLARIAQDVKNGRAFSEALVEYPKIFSHLYVTMVRAGEESGNLPQLLVSIAAHQQRQEEIVSKVKMALAYPCLMLFVGVATVYFILTYVLPKMIGLFDNIGEGLPMPTVILLSISHILTAYWYVIVLVLGGGYFIVHRWLKSPLGHLQASRVMIRLPMFGDIVLKSELSRLCRTMSLLLGSGVSIIKTLEIAVPVLNNELIRREVAHCKEDLLSGGSFGDSIRKSEEIPPMMGHLISLGEESGNLTEVLSEVAETYEQETNEKIKLVTTLLEPLMILGIGLVVGFIVFAMLMPIFQVDVLA